MNEVILPTWNIMRLPEIGGICAKGLTPFRNPMHYFVHEAHIARAEDIYRTASESHPELAKKHENVMDFLQEVPDNGGLLAEFRLLKQINNEAAILGCVEELPPFWEAHAYKTVSGMAVFSNRLIVSDLAESADRIRAAAYISDILEQRFVPFEIAERGTGVTHRYVLLKDDWIEPFSLDYLKYLGRYYSDHVITNTMPQYTDFLVKSQRMEPSAALMKARKDIEELILEPVASCVEGLAALDRARRDNDLRDKFQVRRFTYDPANMPALDAIYEGLAAELKGFASIRNNGAIARVVRWYPDHDAQAVREYEISPRNPLLYKTLIHQMARESMEMRSIKQIRDELQTTKLEKADFMNQLAAWQRDMVAMQQRCKTLEQEYDKLLKGYSETVEDLADVYEKVIDSVNPRLG